MQEEHSILQKVQKNGRVTKVFGQLKTLSSKARQAHNGDASSSESEEEQKEEVKAARANAATPPMLL